MAWVDLGDLYVKKAGDNVTGSIVMANNNLSVAYDADTTYNVGTEIKSLRDSVNNKNYPTYIKDYKRGNSSIFGNVYSSKNCIIYCGNISPGISIKAGDVFATIDLRTPVKKVMEYGDANGAIICRGVFPNKQPAIFVNYGKINGSDKYNRLILTLEQSIYLQIQDTFFMVIPVVWDE